MEGKHDIATLDDIKTLVDHFYGVIQDRWLGLFNTTVDEHFEGEKAERAKWQGQRMAEMFHYKIQYFRDHSSRPLI